MDKVSRRKLHFRFYCKRRLLPLYEFLQESQKNRPSRPSRWCPRTLKSLPPWWPTKSPAARLPLRRWAFQVSLNSHGQMYLFILAQSLNGQFIAETFYSLQLKSSPQLLASWKINLRMTLELILTTVSVLLKRREMREMSKKCRIHLRNTICMYACLSHRWRGICHG